MFITEKRSEHQCLSNTSSRSIPRHLYRAERVEVRGLQDDGSDQPLPPCMCRDWLDQESSSRVSFIGHESLHLHARAYTPPGIKVLSERAIVAVDDECDCKKETGKFEAWRSTCTRTLFREARPLSVVAFYLKCK